MGIPVDFVTAEEELDGYDLVLAPMLMMVSDEGKKNIESYAQAGGKILFSFRSGIKDMYNNMLTETVPGVFADLAGVEVFLRKQQLHPVYLATELHICGVI